MAAPLNQGPDGALGFPFPGPLRAGLELSTSHTPKSSEVRK